MTHHPTSGVTAIRAAAQQANSRPAALGPAFGHGRQPGQDRDGDAVDNIGTQRLHQILQTQEQHPEQQATDATHIERLPGPQQAAPQSDLTLPMPEPDWVDRADWDTSKQTCYLVQTYDWCGLTSGPGDGPPSVNLAVETLVSATDRPADPAAPIEHRTILKLCATSHPVAELAALLKIPLGVVQVVLGDLAAAGNIAVHRTVGSADTASDVALMQRVLAGLQRL